MHTLSIFVLTAVALLVPLVYTPGWFPFVCEDHYLVKLTVVEIAVVLICFALIYSFVRKGFIGIRQTALGWGVVFLLSCFFFSIFVSPVPLLSAEICFRQFCYAVLFLTASHYVSGDEDLGRISFSLAGSAACVALFGVWQHAQGKEVYATIGNRNFLGSFLILALPVAGGCFLKGLHRRKYASAGAAFCTAVLLAAALFLTRSRGAVAALAVSAFLSAVMFLLVKGKMFAALVLILAVFGASAAVAFSPWPVTELAGDVRLYLWQGTMKMIGERPLSGWGIGTFFIHFPAYRPPDYFLLPKAADVTYHPHNEIMSLWAETGIFGAAAFFCVMGMYAAAFFFQWKREGRVDPVRGALFVGSIAVFGQSFVDMNLAIPSVAALFWLSMGVVASGFDRRGVVANSYFSRAPAMRVLAGLSALAILCGAGWTCMVRPVLAQINFGRGSQARAGERWDEVIRSYQKGLRYAPHACDILYKLAYAYDQLGETERAIEMYRRLKGIAPAFARVDFNLAVLYDKTGDLPAARDALKRWLSLNPHDVNAQRYYADIEQRLEK